MKNFTTQSFQLTTTLVALGFPISSMDRSNTKRVRFSFEPSEALYETIDGFHKNLLHVEPQLLFFAIKQVKARIYES